MRTPAKRRSDAQCSLLARECKVWSKFFLRFTEDVLESMWSSLEQENFDQGDRIFDASTGSRQRQQAALARGVR